MHSRTAATGKAKSRVLFRLIHSGANLFLFVGNELGNHANGNGLPLVFLLVLFNIIEWEFAYLITQGKPSHLVVVFKSFSTDRTSTASNLETSNDGLALAGERWWTLALPTSARLTLVQKRGKCHLFNSGVNMNNTVVTRGKNALEFQNPDLGLKGRHGVYGTLRRAEDETR